MAKILFAADLHLRQADKFHNIRVAGDSFHGLRELTRLEQAEQPAAIILGGDIFHSPTPDGVTMAAFREFLRTVQVPVYAIQGNHDRVLTNPHLPIELVPAGCALHSFAQVTDMTPGALYAIAGMHVAALPYEPNGDRARAALHAVPACDVLVCHHAWRHQLGFEGAWHFELADLPAHVGTVLCGHVHVPLVQQLPPRADGSPRWFCSPGSLAPTTHTKELSIPHGAVVLEAGKAPRHVPVSARKVLDLRGLPAADLASALAGADKTVLRPFALVAELPAAPVEGVHLVLCQDGVVPEPVDSEAMEGADEPVGLLAALPAVLDRAARPETFGLLVELLEQQDKEQVDERLARFVA